MGRQAFPEHYRKGTVFQIEDQVSKGRSEDLWTTVRGLFLGMSGPGTLGLRKGCFLLWEEEDLRAI